MLNLLAPIPVFVLIKKVFLLFFLISLPLALLCQITPSLPKWVTNFGSSSGSAITSASKVDAQNNVYVTGPFFGTVDFDPSPTQVKNLSSVGDADVFVAKYDTNGNLVWAVSMGGWAIDQGNGISLDANGNVSVVGQFYSPFIDADPGIGVFNLNNAGNADMFLINLDTNGNFIWATRVGSSGADFINKVAVDKSGAKIIGGQFQGNLTIQNKSLSSSANFSALVAKFNISGTLQWAFNVGSSGSNLITGVSADANDNIIVTGVFNGTANFNPLGAARNVTAGNAGSAFVAKYTTAGQLIWVKSYSGSISACNLALDSQGNVYAVSPYTTPLTFDNNFTLPLTGSRDVCLAKFAPDGTFLWAKSIGGVGSEVVNYEVAASNDNIYFSGYFKGNIDFDPSANVVTAKDHGIQDIFLVRYDSDGNYKWVINTGNSFCTENIGRTVAVDQNNDVILGGAFCSTINFDVSGCTSYNLTAQSYTRDGFLAKYVPSSTGLSNGNITAPSVTTFCGAGDPGLIQGDLPAGGVGIYYYAWQVSADGVSFNNIAGANTKDYDPPTISTTKYFRRVVTSGNCNLPLISNVVKIITTQNASITNFAITTPAVTSFCITADPAPISGDLPAGGSGSYTYQWQNSTDGTTFTDISGAIAQNYDPSIINLSTFYRRVVYSGCGSATSNAVKITIVPAITSVNISTANPTSFCGATDPAIISGNVPVGGTGAYTYQWQSSADGITFFDLNGATQIDYDPSSVLSTTHFRRKTFSGGCEVMSNIIAIDIQPALNNNQITPPVNIKFCSSGDPDLISGSAPTGGIGTYTYQWQTSLNGNVFTDIAGATSVDYNPAVINATTYYRRKVSSGICDDISNIIKITIEPPLTGNVVNAPAVTSFCGNLDPSLIQGAIPSGGNGVYIYQWQSSTDGVTYTNLAGATQSGYDPSVITATMYFRRMVTSGSCAVSFSNVIQFSTYPPVANNQITAPAVINFCGNGDPALTAGSAPTGGDGTYTYQWQRSPNGTTFTDIGGANAKDYDPGVISNSVYYRRKVLSGACESFSNIIQFTVQPVLNNNTITASLPLTFCASGDASVITGNTPPGTYTYIYQWQSSIDNLNFTDITGANSSSFDPSVSTVTTYYRRIVNSTVCVVPLISNVVVITIDQPLNNNTLTAPGVTAFCGSGDADLIIGSAATGGNGTINYQWQASSNGVTFTDIAGATQQGFDPPLLFNSIFYRRLITSGTCNVPSISNVVKIDIDPVLGVNIVTPPLVTLFCGNGQPGIIVGNAATGGNGVYGYQWQRSVDNTTFADISGAVQKDYTPGSLSSSEYYRRTVTSGSCSVPVISNVVFIEIAPVIQNNSLAPPPIVQFCNSGDPSLLQGSTPTGGSGIYAYQWQSSADGLAFTDIMGATSKDFDPQMLSTTTYYRRVVTSGVCNIPQTTNIIKIAVNVLPVINLDAEATICAGSAISLNPSGGDGTFTYQWSPAVGLSNVNISSPTASPSVNTTYTLKVSNGACVVSSSIIVKVIPKPIVNAGADKEIFKGTSVMLDAVVAGENLQFSWSPASYLDNPNIAQPTASPLEDITYTLTVTSTNNCFIVYDDVYVKVHPKVTPPDAFSPNNDGINDVWEVPGLAYYNNVTMSIFNRNGEMLHQSNGNTRGWDGTYKGKVVPFGTYYYIIDIRDKKAATNKISGWITVIR